MKLLDIIWKEISLVKSQKIALLLILIYPVLAIGLLGVSFSGFDVSKFGAVQVGIVNKLDFNSNIVEQVSNLDEIRLIEYQNDNLMRQAITRQDIIVGLIISGSENSQLKIEMEYDNSNLLSSKFFVELAKAIIQKVTAETANIKLQDLFKTLISFSKSIDFQENQLTEFRQMLVNAGKDLNGLENDLKKFDFSNIEEILTTQEETINEFDSELNSFKNDFQQFKTNFSLFKNNYQQLQISLEEYNNDLKELPIELDATIIFLDNTILELNEIKNKISIETGLDKIISDLEQKNSQLKKWKTTINKLITIIEKIKNEESEINKTIIEAEKRINKVNASFNNIELALTSSNQTITNVNNELNIFKESITKIKSLINESKIMKNNIDEKLATSQTILENFSEQIKEFSEINPTIISKPIVFYERGIFSVDPLGILVANATSIVLILTCLLLTSITIILEKNENVLLRQELSTTNKFILATGKIIGQLIIAMVEAVIIFVIAQLFFSVPIINILPQLLIATIIIALSFISIGVLLSFFTKNQSTVILSCLFLVVPMLFLSGIVLPTEFMEPTMRLISNYLPLTISNNILIGIIVKQLTLVDLALELSILGGIFVIIFLVYSLMKERATR